ncbi:MAG: hypothetical protein A3F12_05035 [Gammaproteobacteria bacterium RIFCSPHIGHO2_12_FULL_38_14]|nr:MAG: hypothetical protein A3F12_05035 [Gammaproteobacteria bacterium RIFCSPHIGHO2_12_FULL_38_14]
MCWDELDRDAGKWILPSNKTKNRQAHTIYLSKLSKTLMNELKSITGEFPFVFNTGNNERGYIHSDSLNKAIWRFRKSDDDNLKIPPPLADMKPFTIHDLRRLILNVILNNAKLPE